MHSIAPNERIDSLGVAKILGIAFRLNTSQTDYYNLLLVLTNNN